MRFQRLTIANQRKFMIGLSDGSYNFYPVFGQNFSEIYPYYFRLHIKIKTTFP